jgi:radical SAM enzyme (TIGR01210 family)
MFILQVLPNLISKLNKICGEKTTLKLLNLFTKNQNFFYLDKIYDFDEKNSVSRLTILLPGKGCQWALKTGGCTMCAFWKRAKEIGQNFSGNDLFALFKIAIILTTKDSPVNLTIYNGGSFLNEEEIPFETQLKICKEVNSHPSLKKLFIESRVEFITEEKIKTLKKELGNKTLIIGIGLESQDDRIRNFLIKKGLQKKDYENAIKLLKKNNIRTLTYVFLKPISLSEKEAIEEAIKTIKYAFEVGTDEVALETAFIQEGTVMAQFFKEKKYKPPWLWSIIEVIKKTYHLGPVHVGAFEDEPPPIAKPFNCDLCSKKIEAILQQYRETHDISLLNNLNCSCYELWKKEIGD